MRYEYQCNSEREGDTRTTITRKDFRSHFFYPVVNVAKAKIGLEWGAGIYVG